MRQILIAVLMSGATVAAQTRHPPPPPQPPVSVAPPILLPFPPLMTPPAGGLTPLVPFPIGQTPPRDLYRAGRQKPAYGRPTLPYYGGGYYSDAADMPSAIAPAPPPAATGLLRLAITPGDAQAFIDSAYVGAADDLGKQPLAFSEGMHRLEVRAAGYQGVSVDLRIDRGATLTYRNALVSTREAAPERERLPAASTGPMYVIQNCYLGNVPPRPERLPAGCDIRNVQILGSR